MLVELVALSFRLTIDQHELLFHAFQLRSQSEIFGYNKNSE